MKKTIISTIILVITNICSYYVGSHTWEFGQAFSTYEALIQERKLCNATTEMLHMYWQYYDAEYADLNKDSIIARHNFFDDCIAESEAYQVANSIRRGDWEDFFYDWH